MLDFTSALYLGMRHGSQELQPWEQFSTGRPAALEAIQEGKQVGQTLASLQRCEAGIVSPSTLHLFWDLFNVLAKTEKRIALYVDNSLYPIGWWGIERVRAHGISVYPFPEHDPSALKNLLKRTLSSRSKPLVVTDGLRPGRWGPAPLKAYLECVRAYGGYLIVDDTQALGILGRKPNKDRPYGVGGGGSLEWHDIEGPDILIVSSLGKGFGVPMAILSGSRNMIQRFQSQSDTLVHCSPPSVAVLHAALHALRLNRTEGESRRNRLFRLVENHRRQLRKIGISTTGGPFPVQTITGISGRTALTLNRRLERQGIRTVLHRGTATVGPRLSWLITARHRLVDMNQAVEALAKTLRYADTDLGEIAL